MTHTIRAVFVDAILVRLLRELGLPETLLLIRLSPRVQEWIVAGGKNFTNLLVASPS
jgi:hypothetical protein